MASNETEQLLRKVLAVTEHGVPLDWVDVRVYVVVAIGAAIGSLIGGYAQAFFSNRGEIAAIKKELHYITKIQENIKASISGQLWIDQNFWNLKREVYWKLTSTLSQMSSAWWDLLHHGFLPDRSDPILEASRPHPTSCCAIRPLLYPMN